MKRLSLAQLERQCQKPDHRRIGNWMARRVTRPAALRVTWVVAPLGVSAHAATLLAWACGVGSAIAFGWGSPGGWMLGALLLQLGYLLDHVDGQLARLRGTTSLDGAQLDYLMHHTVDVLVPLGLGHGAFAASGQPEWLWAGTAWAVAALVIGLHHDARYKAFVHRLKRVRGVLEVHGGGGDRPQPQPSVPRRPLRLAAWTARKLCEAHVVMNLLGLIAIASWLVGDDRLGLGRGYLALMAAVAPAVAAVTLVRSQCSQMAEHEFAAWFRPAPGDELTYREGWWTVKPGDNGDNRRRRTIESS
jgi:phosphatidylglycerophosphate synthase